MFNDVPSSVVKEPGPWWEEKETIQRMPFFVKTIEVVKDYPDHSDIIVWSDNCVPHRRYQKISFAVMNFIKSYDHLSSITFHYSIASQQFRKWIICIHSNIEKAMRVLEYFFRLYHFFVLIKTRRVNPYKVMQMIPNDFKDYHTFVWFQCNNKVPYMKSPT